MMSTFQQIALVPPSYLAPIRASSPFQMQANQPRPGIENNTNTCHVSVTKNNLPHIYYYKEIGVGVLMRLFLIGWSPPPRGPSLESVSGNMWALHSSHE
jgi:hypothetical protein